MKTTQALLPSADSRTKILAAPVEAGWTASLNSPAPGEDTPDHPYRVQRLDGCRPKPTLIAKLGRCAVLFLALSFFQPKSALAAEAVSFFWQGHNSTPLIGLKVTETESGATAPTTNFTTILYIPFGGFVDTFGRKGVTWSFSVDQYSGQDVVFTVAKKAGSDNTVHAAAMLVVDDPRPGEVRVRAVPPILPVRARP